MTYRFALLLLLSCASLPLMAREARQSAGDGGCPAAEQQPRAARTADPAAAAKPSAARDAARTEAAGGNDSGARPPRWHSFLPGMFR